MKKLLFTLLAVIVTLTMNAERVSKQEALLKAQQFMPNKQFGEAKAFARGEKADSPAEYEAFYVFNAEGKKGFVIVSGDDRTEPILGYSDRGSLNPDSVPDNVKGLLNYYEKALTAIANDKNYTHPAKTRGVEEKETVEPLLWTEWGQGFNAYLRDPFNMKCPIVKGKWCVSGCVATAMAQIINYHQWPKNETSAVPAYTTYTHQIDMPELEPRKFPWGYLGKWDIANLMLYCGQSVQMDYGVDESSAPTVNVPDVLLNIFGYSDKAKFIIRDDYGDEEWENIIYKEMSEKRPVLYSGFSPSGNGHAFILDGYESGRFHVDWGWDGMCNGYFLLTGLNPDNTMYSDLNHNQDAVIGIQPPDGIVEVVRPKAIVNDVFNGDSKYFWRQNDGKFPAFDITAYIYGENSSKESLQFGWGLCNENGLIAVYGQDQSEIGPDFAEGGYWHHASVTIDKKIPDGDYTIIPVHRSNSSESWIVDINKISGYGVENSFYTDLTIHDDILALRFNYEGGGDYGAYSLVEVRNYIGIYTDTENGISYDLWEDSGIKRATVIPRPSGKYSGDLIIPDIVNYKGDDYVVYEAERSAFNICPDLKSLSTSMYVSPRVSSCPILTKLELREGVSIFDGVIDYNPSLESIEFPKTIKHFYIQFAPFGCDKLSSITFRTEDQLKFFVYPYLNIPTIKDIYFYSSYSPSFEYLPDDFGVSDNTTFHIPQGTLSVYQNTVWDNGKLIEDLNATESNKVLWGYCLDNTISDHTLGIDCKGIRETAMYVPSEMIKPYKNKRITGIQFGGCWMSYFPEYVFLTNPESTDYIIKQAINISPTYQWCTITFDKPYTITGEDFLVGIGRKKGLFIAFSDTDVTEPNGCWGRQLEGGDDSDGIWKNLYEAQPELCHPLDLRFIIEGENLPKDVRLCYPTLDDENNPTKIEMSFVNRCTDLLTSYTIRWDFDGKIKETKTIETCLATGLADKLSIDIPSDLQGYYHTFTIDVLKVNGEDDALPENSHIVYDFKKGNAIHYSRTNVMEELTATWCGWSPRGIETIKRLYDQYPDNFIAIALHPQDEIEDGMKNPVNYQDLMTKFPTTPSCMINRLNHLDPDLNIVKPILEEQMDNAEAMVIANAVYTSEDCKSVKIKTATTFGFNQPDNADFRIAYVVVEDNVGPYLQANNYNSIYIDDSYAYLNNWHSLEDMVEIKHNNVAKGIYPGLNGKEGSVPTSIEKGKAYEYEYTFDLPDNIQDKKNISIVTLLIDNKSGEIINADKTAVVEGELPDIFVEDAVVYEKLDEGKVAITDNGNSGDKCEIHETVTHDGVEYLVTAIAEKAFENNTTLENVTIPQSVTVIGESAFAGCSNLAAIYCYAENPANLTGTVKARSRSGEEVSVASKVFEGVNKETCVLWVPKGCVAAYRNASGWGEFTNIKEMFKPGDANGDGEINETDRNYIVRHITGDTPEDFDEEAADLNGDKKVNVVDLVKLIEILKALNTQSFNEYIWETGVNNNWGSFEQPLYCAKQDGVYTGFFYAQDADWSGGMGAFKFTGAFNSWDNGNYGTGTINDDGLSGTLIDDGGSGNITATPGFYKATVNLVNMTYSLTPIAGIGVVGLAAGSWNVDIDLTYNFETLAWEGTFELEEGEFKFRANDNWDINWGGEANNMMLDGPNLTITEAGTYFIQFFPLCETRSYCILSKK